MEQYPSNSNKSKEQKQVQAREKKVEKAITGQARQRKKSSTRKLADVFLSEDVDSVKSYIMTDVVIPNVKKFIDDVVSNAVHMFLYGDTVSTSRSIPGSKIAYDKIGSPSRATVRPTYGPAAYDFDDVVVDTRGEAEAIISQMDDLMETYGMVSVADLLDLCGITSRFTDNKYGWTDIRSAQAVRIRDGYAIKMPKPKPLD